MVFFPLFTLKRRSRVFVVGVFGEGKSPPLFFAHFMNI